MKSNYSITRRGVGGRGQKRKKKGKKKKKDKPLPASGVIRRPLFTWRNSVVFLPDSHFAHQRYRQTGRRVFLHGPFDAVSTKSTWGSFLRWPSLFISPLSANAIVPPGSGETRRRGGGGVPAGTRKNVFFENDSW